MTEELPKPKSKRGFASMSPEKRSEIARKGGKSVPAAKRSFSQNADLAARAGQKGGRNVAPENRSFSKDAALASTAGAKGGAVSKKHRPNGHDPAGAGR
jgi:general stress protein YciG